MGLFFSAGGPFGSSLSDHLLGVLRHQRLELLIVGGVASDGFGLVGRHIAGDRATVLATLEVVVRSLGTATHDAELARLHPLDLRDLLE